MKDERTKDMAKAKKVRWHREDGRKDVLVATHKGRSMRIARGEDGKTLAFVVEDKGLVRGGDTRSFKDAKFKAQVMAEKMALRETIIVLCARLDNMQNLVASSEERKQLRVLIKESRQEAVEA